MHPWQWWQQQSCSRYGSSQLHLQRTSNKGRNLYHHNLRSLSISCYYQARWPVASQECMPRAAPATDNDEVPVWWSCITGLYIRWLNIWVAPSNHFMSWSTLPFCQFMARFANHMWSQALSPGEPVIYSISILYSNVYSLFCCVPYLGETKLGDHFAHQIHSACAIQTFQSRTICGISSPHFHCNL